MLEYIYICRHGFRANFLDPSIKTGPTKMPRDPPLAVYGVEQSHQLAKFLISPSAHPDSPVPEAVFSSPFYRCIQTAEPTARALASYTEKPVSIKLEHGVQEWYSPVNPNTGLHPRPANAPELAQFFPNLLDLEYQPTLYPSRRGESLKELQDRADLAMEAFTARCEEAGYTSVVIFAHAASVIAMGRALTGDKFIDVPAGCTSCSLYKRKQPSSSTSTPSPHFPPATMDTASASSSRNAQACGVGEWDAVWLGKADYLEKGVERDWAFKDAVIVNGEVITDDGDRLPHPSEDLIPTGLTSGMHKYLRRGYPKKNEITKESAPGAQTQTSKF